MSKSEIKRGPGSWAGKWPSNVTEVKFFVPYIRQESLLVENNHSNQNRDNFKLCKKRAKEGAGMESSLNWLTANWFEPSFFKECAFMNAGTVSPVMGGLQNSAPTIPTPGQESQNIPVVTRHDLRNSTRKTGRSVYAAICAYRHELKFQHELPIDFFFLF